jgi:hypothetical protein
VSTTHLLGRAAQSPGVYAMLARQAETIGSMLEPQEG